MSENVSQGTEGAGGRRWPARAVYPVGRTRRQRKAQYDQQMRFLALVVAAALLFGLGFAYLSWQGAGSTRSLSCADYPQYCVPLAGGGPQEAFEAPASRELDGEGDAAPGVVRGATDDGMPLLGDPDAPLKMAVVSDFACSHCQAYHDGDLKRIVDDFVLTGQVQFQLVMVTGTGGPYSEMASQVALCAGEQGAFWEMQDELYRLAQSQGVASAFSIENLLDSAGAMGLDERALRRCVSDGRYRAALLDYTTFASDNGVTGTPSVLVNSGDGWRMVRRDYDTIAAEVARSTP